MLNKFQYFCGDFALAGGTGNWSGGGGQGPAAYRWIRPKFPPN